jgi:hypothetical protein
MPYLIISFSPNIKATWLLLPKNTIKFPYSINSEKEHLSKIMLKNLINFQKVYFEVR